MRSERVTFEAVEDKIILIREQKVILDSDVAALYGVETRDVNKSVKNNPDKFQHTTDSETTIELNLAVLKVKHTVKRTSETKE